jgi:hypothetical protein
MDYELAMPVNYTVKQLSFNLTPYLAMPVSPAHLNVTVKPSSGTTYSKSYTEKLNTTFYWSFKMAYRFECKKAAKKS